MEEPSIAILVLFTGLKFRVVCWLKLRADFFKDILLDMASQILSSLISRLNKFEEGLVGAFSSRSAEKQNWHKKMILRKQDVWHSLNLRMKQFLEDKLLFFIGI